MHFFYFPRPLFFLFLVIVYCRYLCEIVHLSGRRFSLFLFRCFFLVNSPKDAVGARSIGSLQEIGILTESMSRAIQEEACVFLF